MPDSTSLNSMLDKAARDELAVRNLDLIARVVGRLPIAMPQGVDRDDLLSAGTIGLLNAARTYQPMRGASFRTFAYLAIKSAVLDELRRADPLPRGARSRLKEVEKIESEWRVTAGRPPTPEELAERMSLERDELESLLEASATARLLDAPTNSLDGEESPTFDPEDTNSTDVLEKLSRTEQLARIEDAIASLTPRERQVFVLYHSENLYLKEIGRLLEVTESRVCQILSCAEAKVRARAQRGKSDTE